MIERADTTDKLWL